MSAAHAISWAAADRGQAVIDAHSPVHFVVGFAAGVLGIDPHLALISFVGAKIVDESLRKGPKHAVLSRERGQSLGNELSDILFEIGGLYYGKMLRTKLLEREAAQAAAAPAAASGLGHPAQLNVPGVRALIAWAESGYPETFPYAGLGIDYHDPLTHRYEDYMSYPRIR